SVTATRGIVTTSSSIATTRGIVTTSSSIATTRGVLTTSSSVTATRHVGATGDIRATRDIGATGRVATTGRVFATSGGVAATRRVVLAVDTDVHAVLVGLGVDADTRDVDADPDGLRRTCGGERGACGNDRTRGYPRDAYSRLLRHVLLPPVAVLVNGAAICGATALRGLLRTPADVVPRPCRPPPITPVPDIRMLLQQPVQS
ncbi:hypothetical protein ACIQUY_21885, partial [Streptomyces sp. NPDC090231]|uniref:hypothetical protein n=1 Tax=Streptomyces sp. NPDC090231 TaxID=3365958 RepID=UPI003816E3BF